MESIYEKRGRESNEAQLDVLRGNAAPLHIDTGGFFCLVGFDRDHYWDALQPTSEGGEYEPVQESQG